MKLSLFGAFSLSAAAVFAGDFTLTDTTSLKLDFKGTQIVAGEAFTLLKGDGLAGSKSRQENINGAFVTNHYGQVGQVPYRRELALTADGSQLEVNLQTRFQAYDDDVIDKMFTYAIRVPFSLLKGGSYTGIAGRSSRTTEVKGMFTDTADGGLKANRLRCLFISAKCGDIVIDCDPKGINSHGDYGPTAVVGVWSFTRDGDYLLCSLNYKPKFYGGALCGKLVIYAGTPADFDKRHAHRAYPYFSELEPDRNYSFGAAKTGKAYTHADTAAFTGNAGWLDATALKTETFRPSGALYSAVCGTGSAVFRMTGLRSGLHIITLAAATGDTPVGPFSFTCNGYAPVPSVTIPPRTVQTVSFCRWIEDGQADIAFTGTWRLSTISDQLLQASAEDFTFRRGFWFAKGGPFPAEILQDRSYAAEPAYSVKAEAFPLPDPGHETDTPRKTWSFPSSHAVFATPDDDWRGRAIIGTIGPSNNGDFEEFNTPAKLRRRIAELVDNRTDTITIDGFLSRHTFPSHAQRVERYITTLTKAAHDKGITVIDHLDYSLLWNMDGGFRVLTERMPHLQVTIDGHLPNRGLCPVNPDSLKLFFDTIVRHAQITGIDGIMIDEACFQGSTFCGCAHCRKAFQEETGWELPADELSPVFNNKESELWRTWCAWRQKKVGDFWYQLKSRLKDINPSFVAMGYTTHYGMTSTYGSLGHGSTLQQLARGWDFIGTEIMSRNIYASYRSVQAYRKMKNTYRNTFGIPVFGLVYSSTSDWDVLYFGWALNNMNAQATWEMSGIHCPAGKSNYRLFKEDTGNIRLRDAQPVANVAVLFSNASRDWPRMSSYVPDMNGFSQVMSANHFQHEFINEESLTAAALKPYSVLLVNNAMAISPEQLQAALDFAGSGGTVYFSHRVATSDNFGKRFDKWPLADVFHGFTPNLNKTLKAKTITLHDATVITPEEPFFTLPCPNVTDDDIDDIDDIKVLWNATLEGGAIAPALIERKLGKGRVLYSPCLFGQPAACSEFTTSKPFTFVRKPVAESAIVRLITEIVAPGTNVWNPGNTPEKVLTSIYRDGNDTTVHFLNATGSNMKPGDIIPGTPVPPVFPKLTADIVFSIKLPSLTKAFAASPDFPGITVKLAFTRLDDGSFQITLPADTLTTYTVVHLQ